MKKTSTTARRVTVPASPVTIPDRVIKFYFGIFPIVIATFLSVQAVRAHTLEDTAPAPTPAATEVAR